jgi:hypothetical protein
MSDFEARFAQALHDAVPDPPRELEASAIGTARRRRSRRFLAPALAVAVVVAVAVAGALMVAAHRSVNRPATDNSPTAATLRAVQRLLEAAPVLPDAVEVDHAPVTALRQPFESVASTNLVARTRWWTAPGSVAAALAYLNAHSGPGTVGVGSVVSNWTGRSTVVRLVDFTPTGGQWSKPGVFSDLKLNIALIQDGDHVAVRPTRRRSGCPSAQPPSRSR